MSGEAPPSPAKAGSGEAAASDHRHGSRSDDAARGASLSDAFARLAEQRAKHRQREAAERAQQERMMAKTERTLKELERYARETAEARTRLSHAGEQLSKALQRMLAGDPDGFRAYAEAMSQYTGALSAAARIRPPMFGADQESLPAEAGGARRRDPAAAFAAARARFDLGGRRAEGLPSWLSREQDRPNVSRAPTGS